jgi:hypothetical protein
MGHMKPLPWTTRRATAAAWVSVTAVSLAGGVLTVMASGHLVTSDKVSNLGGAPSAVLYATLGALVVRRAGNVIGWFLLGIGAGVATFSSGLLWLCLFAFCLGGRRARNSNGFDGRHLACPGSGSSTIGRA